MQYRVWAAKDKPATRTFTIFVNVPQYKEDVKIRLLRGKLTIKNTPQNIIDKIKENLCANGVNFDGNYTLTSLISSLSLSQLSISWHGKYEHAESSSEYAAKIAPPNQDFKPYISNESDLDEIYRKTQELDISTVPFIKETDCYEVVVDSREPSVLQAILSRSPISDIRVASLEIGDILIRNKLTNDTLVIERKTTQDLETSTVSKHLHSQSERLHDYRCAIVKSGSRCRIMWFIEAQNNAQTLFYNSLTHVRNVDGVVNYLAGILDQHVIHTYSTNHTAYLAIKMAQGFFEEQLRYSVNTAKTKAKRQKLNENASSNTDHGVSVSSRGGEGLLAQIPGINRTIAKQLADSKTSIAKLCSMSIEELCEIDGIGKKNAEKIKSALEGK